MISRFFMILPEFVIPRRREWDQNGIFRLFYGCSRFKTRAKFLTPLREVPGNRAGGKNKVKSAGNS
jgi:hypothetical protein